MVAMHDDIANRSIGVKSGPTYMKQSMSELKTVRCLTPHLEGDKVKPKIDTFERILGVEKV